MSPKILFEFLNTLMQTVAPVIRNHNGFIDKYIGDAIMALFPGVPDDAIDASLEMTQVNSPQVDAPQSSTMAAVSTV